MSRNSVSRRLLSHRAPLILMVAPDVDRHLPCISNPGHFPFTSRLHAFLCLFFFSALHVSARLRAARRTSNAMLQCVLCLELLRPGLAVVCMGARVRPHPSLKIGHHPHVHFIDSRIRFSFSGSTSALASEHAPASLIRLFSSVRATRHANQITTGNS